VPSGPPLAGRLPPARAKRLRPSPPRSWLQRPAADAPGSVAAIGWDTTCTHSSAPAPRGRSSARPTAPRRPTHHADQRTTKTVTHVVTAPPNQARREHVLPARLLTVLDGWRPDIGLGVRYRRGNGLPRRLCQRGKRPPTPREPAPAARTSGGVRCARRYAPGHSSTMAGLRDPKPPGGTLRGRSARGGLPHAGQRHGWR
jgi:hypothetical protein